MYFNNVKGGYRRDNEQWSSGDFLMLFCGPTGDRDMRACARFVRMHQTGHFLMGRVYLGGRWVSLSGAYGQDGLPMNAPIGPHASLSKITTACWNTLLPVPKDLQDAFWRGGGHNSTGNEAPALATWATANLAALKKHGRIFPRTPRGRCVSCGARVPVSEGIYCAPCARGEVRK